MSTSTNSSFMIFCRLLTGFFAGLICGIAPTYCAEIATKDIRGRLGTYFQIGVTVGIFAMSAFGLFLNWRQLALMSLIFPICTIVLLFFVPETPYFLLKSKPTEPQNALDLSLRPLRVPGSNLQKELDEILATVHTGNPVFLSLEMCKQRDFYVPLMHALFLMYFQQFSGTVHSQITFRHDFLIRFDSIAQASTRSFRIRNILSNSCFRSLKVRTFWLRSELPQVAFFK
jgi:MFS family permease